MTVHPRSERAMPHCALRLAPVSSRVPPRRPGRERAAARARARPRPGAGRPRLRRMRRPVILAALLVTLVAVVAVACDTGPAPPTPPISPGTADRPREVNIIARD